MNGQEGRPYVPIGGPLNICNTCAIPHYDNCPDCFGFGVTADNPGVPISAFEAIEKVRNAGWFGGGEGPLRLEDWNPCPTCQSTPSGIPDDAGPEDVYWTV